METFGVFALVITALISYAYEAFPHFSAAFGGGAHQRIMFIVDEQHHGAIVSTRRLLST